MEAWPRLEYVSIEICEPLLCYPTPCYTIPSIPRVYFFQIYIPIKEDPHHWYLMVVDIAEGTLWHLDSYLRAEDVQPRRQIIRNLVILSRFTIIVDMSYEDSYIKLLLMMFVCFSPLCCHKSCNPVNTQAHSSVVFMTLVYGLSRMLGEYLTVVVGKTQTIVYLC